MRIREVAAEARLTVGARGHELEICAASSRAIAQEPRDGLPTLVLVRLGRHREPGVLSEHRYDALSVAALDRGGEAAHELALPRGTRERCALAGARDRAFIYRRSRSLQRAFDGRFAALEHLGDLTGEEAEHVAEHKRSTLARRQMMQRNHECESDRLSCFVARLRARGGVRK